MKRLCYIDVETTGLNVNKHAIIQLAYIIEIDGEVKETGSYKINPKSYSRKVEISSGALAISGTSIEDLETYDDSAECFAKFKKVLNSYIAVGEKLTLVAYNAVFDLKFLQAWFNDNGSKDYGRYFTYKELDVFALVKYLVYLDAFPTLQSHTLSKMCEWAGIELEAHNALSDIIATRALQAKLLEYINIGELK